MKNVITLITIIIILTSCRDKNSIRQDELILRFPIVVSLLDQDENWEIENFNPPYFKLSISKITHIYYNDLIFEGDYEISLVYSDELKTEKANDLYSFFQIMIDIKDTSFVKIVNDILSQDRTLYECNCYRQTVEWIDINNGVCVIVNEGDNKLTFIDLEKFYSNPENRFHFEK